MLRKAGAYNKKSDSIFGTTRKSIAILIFLSALFVFLSLCLTKETAPLAEDAFITFRCVENFVRGNGMVFNKNERLEVISNISWALLLACLSKLGLPLLLTAFVVNQIFGILTIWTVWLFSLYYLDRGSYFQFIAPVLLATHTTFISHSISGLETAFYSFLITLGTLVATLENTKGSRFPYSAIIFAIASMTRPEAPLLFVVILLSMLVKDFLNQKISQNSLMSFITFSTLYGFFIVFRVYYYNDILPNPVYLRSSLEPTMNGSIVLLLNFIVDTKSYIIFFPIFFLLLDKKPKNPLHPIPLVVITLLILLFFSANEIGFLRYLSPLLPLCFLMVQEGIFKFATRFYHFSSLKGYKQFLVPFSVLFIIMTNLLWHKTTLKFPAEITYNSMTHSFKMLLSDPYTVRKKFYIWKNIQEELPPNFHVSFGDWIRKNLPIHSIIVYDQMGQTPFYAGLDYTFIDSWGLTDRTITSIKYPQAKKIRNVLSKIYSPLKSNMKQDGLNYPDYILSRNPDYIFIRVGTPYLFRLTRTLAFRIRYQSFSPDVPLTLKKCYRKDLRYTE